MFGERENAWQVLNNLPESSYAEGDRSTEGCYKVWVGTDQRNAHVVLLPTLLFMIVLELGLLSSQFIVPAMSHTLSSTTNAFSVNLYIYVVFWALIMFLTWNVYRECYHIWVVGYHNFYNTTKFLHGASLQIYTAGLALMNVLSASVRDYCPAGALVPCGDLQLSPVNYQQLVTLLVTMPAVLCTIKLSTDVHRFNQCGLPVDVLVDDLGVRLSETTPYVGIGRPSSIQTLLEVQGSAIATLRARVNTLNRQVAALANELEKRVNAQS